MKEKEYLHLVHTHAPVWDKDSEILILGTFPSVQSRETGFYYGHPQNRFWRVMTAILHEQMPVTTEEKKQILLAHHIALWDVIAECDIVGSSDSSIKNVLPNNVNQILQYTKVRKIFVNGATSERLYIRYLLPITHKTAIRLPSTSPANAAWTFERLCEAWNIVADELDREKEQF